tara:strand:+ start:6449 stop:8734 length:2286 start_codon:yes stop_codon:yes gene_type:complete
MKKILILFFLLSSNLMASPENEKNYNRFVSSINSEKAVDCVYEKILDEITGDNYAIQNIFARLELETNKTFCESTWLVFLADYFNNQKRLDFAKNHISNFKKGSLSHYIIGENFYMNNDDKNALIHLNKAIEGNLDEAKGLKSYILTQSNSITDDERRKALKLTQDCINEIPSIEDAEDFEITKYYFCYLTYSEFLIYGDVELKIDIKKGRKILNILAKKTENGYPEFLLGFYYCFGPGEVNYNISDIYIKEAINKKSSQAITFNIQNHMNSFCGKISQGDKIVSLFNQAKDIVNDKYLENLMGLIYINGNIVKQDVNKGIEILNRNKIPENLYVLGIFYLGLNEKSEKYKDIDKAHNYLLESIELAKEIPFGDINTELYPHYTLARLYAGEIEKDWHKKDIKKSYLYLESGCNSKIGFYEISCFEQIKSLILGRGVNKDIKKAAKIAHQLFVIEKRKALLTDLVQLLSEEEEFSNYFGRLGDEDNIDEPEEVTLTLAILVGASKYISENINDLPQAKNDVLDLKNVLNRFSHENYMVIIDLIDPNHQEFETIKDMARRFNETEYNEGNLTDENDTKTNINSIFYYSGHAISYQGKNYLLPIDTPSEANSFEEIRPYLISLDNIVKSISSFVDGKKIFILDACRTISSNNSSEISSIEFKIKDGFLEFGAGSNNGLAPFKADKNSYIIYSTSPGNISLIRNEERNSIFSKHLIKEISSNPGRDLQTTIQKVRNLVLNDTNSVQIPWDESSLTDNFYFDHIN